MNQHHNIGDPGSNIVFESIRHLFNQITRYPTVVLERYTVHLEAYLWKHVNKARVCI